MSFEERIPLSDTTCLMVTHKDPSHRSFTDSTGVETEFPHCSEGLANECRSWAVTGAAAATLQWTRAQYDRQYKTTPGRAEILLGSETL